MASKSKGLKKVGDQLDKYIFDDTDKYISREFQKYGYELAKELGDLKNKALYIKLAKETPRGQMESARSFVKDAHNVKSPGKLFMWKLGQIKDESKKNTKK
ncbi:hypothetical protein ACFL0F_02050 [Patescibacteria group bacterium]